MNSPMPAMRCHANIAAAWGDRPAAAPVGAIKKVVWEWAKVEGPAIVPRRQTKTGLYDSQVRSKPGRGKAVVSGIATGPNQSGQVIEQIKTEIETSRSLNDDPLTGQRLPKQQRDLTRQYFDAFREGAGS